MGAVTRKQSTQLALPGETTAVSLSLPNDLSFEEWYTVGDQLAQADRALTWWLGDWWRYGEHAYGDRASQVLNSEIPAFQTCANAGWVAGKIEASRRREALSWSHHAEVASLPPEQQDELLEWAASTGASQKELRREIRNRKATSSVSEREFPSGKYGVLYADPPWQYEHSKTDSRRIENHYPTMDLQAICNLPVQELAGEDCVLFLWATSPKLAEAMEVLAAWGFTYRTQAVWVKPQIGMGYYFRQRHEPLLVAASGEPSVPEPKNRPASVIEHPRGEHSAKPPQVYELIEAMYPDLPKIELFARAARSGWDVWGNQVGS